MSEKQSNLDEFSSLIRELETPRNRPTSPLPPAQFMADLRRRLLQNYDQQLLSRRGMMRLWRFAGTAVALIIVAVAVGYVWLALSSSSPTVSPDAVAVPEIQGDEEIQEDALETAVSPDKTDRVWLISASPEPGTNLHATGGEPIIFKLEIGYSLVSQPKAMIIADLVPRNMHISPDRAPQIANDIIRHFVHIQAGDGAVTLEIPLSSTQPDNITSVIMPEIIMLTKRNENHYDVFFSHKLKDVQWVFNTTSEGKTGDRVWLVSATQKKRVTAMVSFEVRLGMEINSTETAVYQLHIAHPDWENNGLIARNSLTFQPAFHNAFRLTATPDQIRQATGTDNPVLVVEFWSQTIDSQPQSTQIEPAIRETFTVCPMDLTRSDEFTCVP